MKTIIKGATLNILLMILFCMVSLPCAIDNSWAQLYACGCRGCCICTSGAICSDEWVAIPSNIPCNGPAACGVACLQSGGIPLLSFATCREFCLALQIYGEDSEETELLRNFRDNVLSKTPTGQEIIRLYYEWSPAIVEAMEEDEEFKEEIEEMIDGVLMLIAEEAE